MKGGNDRSGGFHLAFLDPNKTFKALSYKMRQVSPFGFGNCVYARVKLMSVFCHSNWDDDSLIQKDRGLPGDLLSCVMTQESCKLETGRGGLGAKL